MNKIFALVDCNAFFCSCEQLFRPDLRGQPVGVLSNNDGCFVSRTKELKELGVKMGAPYFKVKALCDKNNVTVFSSNFSLYTNMSDRVMSVLSRFTPRLEVYSVDEAFLDLTGFSDIDPYIAQIKKTVEKLTGIPVGIGVGPTKTLAKIANHVAKKSTKAQGLVNLMSPHLQDEALKRVSIEDVWGVGRASSLKMRSLGVKTAYDYKNYKNTHLIKKVFTKVGLQRLEELNGKSRFELELVPKKKKELLCSRTFSQPVFSLRDLRESVASYVSSACEKLRKQGSVCSGVEVYARTSPFKNTNQYSAFEGAHLLSPSSDTRKVVRYAFCALDKLYRAGYEYKKAGVRLSGLQNSNEAQLSLLDIPDDRRSERLMQVLDEINARDGAGTVKLAICGLENKSWAMNRKFKSPKYVTDWLQLKNVL